MMNNKVYGDYGESLACKYLKKQGYKIIETNYKNKIGEVDIICKDKDMLVFVEVKTRSTMRFGMPREAITPHKINKIRLVATSYMKAHDLPLRCRFDCVEILDDEITHLKNVF